MINNISNIEMLKPLTIPGMLPQTQTRTYINYANNTAAAANSISSARTAQLLMAETNNCREERVKVQRLINHTKLQNNTWNNFRTLYNNLSVSNELRRQEEDHIMEDEHKQQQQQPTVVGCRRLAVAKNPKPYTPTTSAFNLEINHNHNQSNGQTKSRSNNINDNFIQTNGWLRGNHNYNRTNTSNISIESSLAYKTQRTVDQEDAFRRIESVHNYAKLRPYHVDVDDVDDDDDEDNDVDINSPSGSGSSSNRDDDDSSSLRDDAESNKIDEDDIDIDVDYEHYFNNKRQQQQQQQKQQSLSDYNAVSQIPEMNANNIEMDFKKEPDLQIDVNVKAAAPIKLEDNVMYEKVLAKPQHHARRPMNAFLIFCKRHRAIVKERYKSLENRAITRILGDWWATLDDTSKECFIKLAQENKDAFFSAHPNFKWYKLPAPPLRSLNTRPLNSSPPDYNVELRERMHSAASRRNPTNGEDNYFKFADETQMGELSTLMRGNNKVRQCALQQALGETTQFLTTHIPGNMLEMVAEDKQLKRRLYSENSFSSNSSEEDGLVPKKKNARSCKGKIYQELINSGQITPHVKKSKSSSRLTETAATAAMQHDSQSTDQSMKAAVGRESLCFLNHNSSMPAAASIYQVANSYELKFFDLEEKIKELPALCLDDYLQRKRCTKKKKKFSYCYNKKRNHHNNNNNNNNNKVNNDKPSNNNSTNNGNNNNNILKYTTTTTYAGNIVQNMKREGGVQEKAAIVGSQKRKARKESITRRDVSAIENEVAAVLTINGDCYLQETPISPITYHHQQQQPQHQVAANQQLGYVLTTSTKPTTTTTTYEFCNKANDNNNISSTSDLLILAEVAAKRTELHNNNNNNNNNNH